MWSRLREALFITVREREAATDWVQKGEGGWGIVLKAQTNTYLRIFLFGQKEKTCYMCDAESMTHVTHPGDGGGGGDGDGDAESMTPVTHPGVISSRYLDTHVNSHTFLPPLTY